MSLPHSGKTAIVTGSSRGIGKAVALKLAQEGANVVVCARSIHSTSELPGSITETATAIQAMGRQAIAIRTDVTNDSDGISMVTRALEEFGRIDILVNNAALAGLMGTGNPFIESTTTLLDRCYMSNVRAPFIISRLVSHAMARTGGGAIVNISSMMGRLPRAPTSTVCSQKRGVNMAYAISKAALDRFSASIASELFDMRIGVVTVYPPLTRLERLANRRDIDLSGADSPDVTANAVSKVCEDPMRYTGQFLEARRVAFGN
jgi:NAD(P)-dependent dehydrogenase (short-subunit alcohol dehydrogenase family)